MESYTIIRILLSFRWDRFSGLKWEELPYEQWEQLANNKFIFYGKENITIYNIYKKFISKMFHDNIIISDSLNLMSTKLKKLCEKISILDGVKKIFRFKGKENIILTDSKNSFIEFILSDLIIFSKYIDMFLFEDISQRAFGFTNFQTLIVGEYEYKNALVKMQIDTVANSPKLFFPRWKYMVDIPDKIDKGRIEYIGDPNFQDGYQYVEFNIKYYYIPEVTVTIVGGTNIYAIPDLANQDPYRISTEGFYVKVTDTTGALLNNVQVSWQAIGGTTYAK